MTPPRFLVGIDLGTTNSVVAAIDLAARKARFVPRVVPIPQVIAPGEVRADPTLPSFLYLPTPDERASGRFGTPWDRHPALVAGAFARDQGALQPARQVSSAKSWLSHPTADRTARILPWGADEPSVSPVEASARILRHLRDAWNHELATEGEAAALEHQHVVLTVPASFDQEARELTVQAAHEAGLESLTLIEEPLATFYAFLARTDVARSRGASAGRAIAEAFQDGEEVLVCDVGGGTTDFTTIRVRIEEEEEVRFERTAVGEHLLLGGDNLDLALARRIESRLGDRTLTLVQKLALRRTVAASKERLLSDPALDRVPVTILGSGRAIVGASLASQLTRDEVISTLTEGFLPMVGLDDRPHAERRTGLLEMGLPFAADPAITRHLAAFLASAARSAGEDRPRRPDAVLFNGGFFSPALARQRIVDTLARWFAPDGSWRPRVLENPNPASAVAIGAAQYALVRERGGLRVRAGSARAYYLGLSGGERTAEGGTAICVLPRGAEEGSTFEIAREGFTVTTNRPVSFPLSSSAVRKDRPGDLVTLAEDEIHRHAPLATVLRYGKRSRQVELEVSLSARYTETGTLEVSCASRSSEHRWRLRFQLRGERDWEAPPVEGPETESVVAPESVEAARELLRAAFAPRPPGGSSEGTAVGAVTPETLPARLEAALGYGRLAWETPVARALADTLIEVADGRRFGPRYEARWLNLLGFCLRPGFGAPADDWRIGRLRGVYVEGLLFQNDAQCQSEWAVLWQRVAGGLKAGQQRELYLRYSALVGLRERKTRRVNPQVQREAWRLLASLEHLPARDRASLGDALIERLDRDRDNASYLWAIGRLGARVPAYGPLSAVVPPDRAAAWIERLLAVSVLTPERAAAIVQVGARTDDPLRDLGDDLRARAARRLADAGFADEADPLLTPQAAASRSALQIFGESLPPGLRVLAPGG